MAHEAETVGNPRRNRHRHGLGFTQLEQSGSAVRRRLRAEVLHPENQSAVRQKEVVGVAYVHVKPTQHAWGTAHHVPLNEFRSFRPGPTKAFHQGATFVPMGDQGAGVHAGRQRFG